MESLSVIDRMHFLSNQSRSQDWLTHLSQARNRTDRLVSFFPWLPWVLNLSKGVNCAAFPPTHEWVGSQVIAPDRLISESATRRFQRCASYHPHDGRCHGLLQLVPVLSATVRLPIPLNSKSLEGVFNDTGIAT